MPALPIYRGNSRLEKAGALKQFSPTERQDMTSTQQTFETVFNRFQETGICMYATYCASRRAAPITVQEKCNFPQGDTGYYSGGYILISETFSLSSFLSLLNGIRETRRKLIFKKKYILCVGQKKAPTARFFPLFSFPSLLQIQSDQREGEF